MAITISAGLVAFLARGSSRQRLARHDVVVAVAFGEFALANLVLPVVARLSGDAADRCSRIGPLSRPAVRRGHPRPRRGLAAALVPHTLRGRGAGLASVAVLALSIGATTSHHIPTRVCRCSTRRCSLDSPFRKPVRRRRPSAAGCGVLRAGRPWCSREWSDRYDDEFWGWLGAGCALVGRGQRELALFPPLGTVFCTADILRGGRGCSGSGCGREIPSYGAGWSRWRRRGTAAHPTRPARRAGGGAGLHRQPGRAGQRGAAVEQLDGAGRSAARRALTEFVRIRARSTGDEPLRRTPACRRGGRVAPPPSPSRPRRGNHPCSSSATRRCGS